MVQLFLIWMFEWFWCLTDLIIRPRIINYEKGLHREVSCKSFDPGAYNDLEKKEFTICSDYGYLLSCVFIEGHEPGCKKLVILCHALGCAKYSSIKYMELFLKLGFSVLMYDHRNHGQSGKTFTSMGFYEKYDLRKVVDWCYNKFGKEIKIVTHGESMGASTVLMHLGIDNRVKCAIADCAFSDLILLLRHQLKQNYHLPLFLIPYASCLTYLRTGFRYKEVSPISVVSRTDIPVLFIHGKIDNLVPAYMSRQMYDCKKKNKAIYLVAKARHAESFCKNKEGYERKVNKFLKTYLE